MNVTHCRGCGAESAPGFLTASGHCGACNARRERLAELAMRELIARGSTFGLIPHLAYDLADRMLRARREPAEGSR